MQRVVILILAPLCLAGCQVQDPFAVFGPQRVPAPSTVQSSPYYPPTAGAAKPPPLASAAGSPRLSVSAESAPLPLLVPTPRLAAEPGDAEQIRIVENPNPPTRTATVPSRPTTPSKAQQQPGPLMPVPTKSGEKPPQSRLVPEGPQGGPSATVARFDSAVAPASFNQPGSPFRETATAADQWRTR
jgi:hypothetical protein